ncbi:sulfotransferase family 2 domain-containing protein [Salinimonas marina]|uniref:Sulfotransferase family 2 domain-containing protein n=1 Tax=Salinimonas marina TaxID=2785918 RepID=A0A7S9DZ54_9ALTE|nr:sulfotransferase family 2 domain-containing protein [Salinimonas marina]QPG06025.1 sulfotransferase family 2 domain-containing protein [Salinimonas marina]
MAYKIHPLWHLERLVSPARRSITFPHPKVTLLSHHIPKTAGSSLRVAFERALGRRHVYGVYANTGAAEMSSGQDIWVPRKATILHGHFRPHPNHTEMFPNALRAVWVRDPIERIWSLVGHLLSLKERHPHYNLMINSGLKADLDSQESIVHEMITTNVLNEFTRTYSSYFSAVPIETFSFVGSKHSFEEDLNRLSDMVGVNLKMLRINRRSDQSQPIPAKIRRLETYLPKEYEIVGDYL